MRRTAFITSASPRPMRVEPAPHFVHVHRIRTGGQVITYAERSDVAHKGGGAAVITAQERRDALPVATATNGWPKVSGATLAQRAVRG